jgi:acyl-[acyl-carrier-protein] desaturase
MSDQHASDVQFQIELLGSLEDVVKSNLNLLASRETMWQPTDYLPDLAAEDWVDQVKAFRGPAMNLSDELLVVLVGDMVTEEALPNYAITLNHMVRDEEGDSDRPWALWMRGWVSEENRHGDLLNAYLRLTGRVDMRSIEVTVQRLINDGFNPRSYPDPYCGLIYTSFQERATKISHMNVGRFAAKAGDERLGNTRMMGEVFLRDPATSIILFRRMLRQVITMPGRLMDDGQDEDLFEHFATVAQRMGVYTVVDYAAIIRHLVATWKIGTLAVSGKAAACQDAVCGMAERVESMAAQVAEEMAKRPATKFSWIYNRMA